jgi:branched-chain amino acid transport system substrate-binding protein
VVAQEFFKLRDTDFSAQMTNALAAQPDALIVRGYGDESTLITKAARQFGFKGPIIWQSQAPADTVLKNISAGEMQGVISMYPATAGEYAQRGSKTAAALVDAFRKKFNTVPGELSPFSYDAVFMLKAAIRKAGSVDNAAVNGALATLTAADVPELVNRYELGPGGRLFDDKGQVKVYGIAHVWKGNDWSQAAE